MQSQIGGFQAMTQDALTVLNDIPFSIPPYFALLGRAIVTLEGVALSGDPKYAIIKETYPFVARKLLRGDRPEIQKALQEVLYGTVDGSSSGLKLTRLLALLNNAAGAVATQVGAVFVDLDSVPDNGLSLQEGLQFLLSEKTEGLRNLLEKEIDAIVDVISRQVFRRTASEVLVALSPPRPPSIPFLGNVLPQPPILDEIPLPVLLPSVGDTSRPSLGILSIKELIEYIAPKLDQSEEIFAISIGEGAQQFFGAEIGNLIKGERMLSPQTAQLVIQALQSGSLGRNDILSSSVARQVIQFVKTALNAVQPSPALDNELTKAIASLNKSERARFDSIVEQVTQRGIQRVVKRLSRVERVA
jgi:aarF domain-containing kinase